MGSIQGLEQKHVQGIPGNQEKRMKVMTGVKDSQKGRKREKIE